jgi:hypothetical protein
VSPCGDRAAPGPTMCRSRLRRASRRSSAACSRTAGDSSEWAHGLWKVPPRSPLRDILLALAAEDLGNEMSPEVVREVRRVLLRQIAEVARRELENL